jgi:hypothetical protein
MREERDEEERASTVTPFPLWEQEFNKYLRENKFTRDALDKLLVAGCQRRTVTGLLYPYCFDLKPPVGRLTSERWRALSKKLIALANELDEASREVEELCKGVGIVSSIALQLKADGELLRLFPPAIRRETNLRHSYGQSFFLVRLSLYIREATERGYCDKELAYLVEAAFGAAGEGKHFDEDAVRKSRDRFGKRNSISYARLKLDAEEYFNHFGRQGDPESKRPFLEWCELRQGRDTKSSIIAVSASFEPDGLLT